MQNNLDKYFLNLVKEKTESLGMFEFESYILNECNDLIQSTSKDQFGDTHIILNDGSKLCLEFRQDTYDDDGYSKLVEYFVLHDYNIHNVYSNHVIWG